MINGFENITYRLTEEEKSKLLPAIISEMKCRIGVDKAITNKGIVEKLSVQFDNNGKPLKIGEARIRKMVNHIRRNGLIKGLIATSKGYYVTKDPVELERYIGSLRTRAKAINRVSIHMKADLRQMLSGPAA